jgi:hypothetical protein
MLLLWDGLENMVPVSMTGILKYHQLFMKLQLVKLSFMDLQILKEAKDENPQA